MQLETVERTRSMHASETTAFDHICDFISLRPQKRLVVYVDYAT